MALAVLTLLFAGCGKKEEDTSIPVQTEEKNDKILPYEEKPKENPLLPVEPVPEEEETIKENTVEISKPIKEEYGNDEVTLLTKEVNDVTVILPEYPEAADEINAFFIDRNAAWEDTVGLYAELAEEAYTELLEDEEWKCRELERQYTLKRLDDKMISIVEDLRIYMGEEPAKVVRVAYNFETATGKRLMLKDVADDLDEIHTESTAYIKELLTEPEYAEILNKNYAGRIPDILTDSTWYTADGGLYIICNTKIIASEKQGIMEFFLPYDEVDVICNQFQ